MSGWPNVLFRLWALLAGAVLVTLAFLGIFLLVREAHWSNLASVLLALFVLGGAWAFLRYDPNARLD